MGIRINRYDIVLVKLHPTVGKEITKIRPAIIISPTKLNAAWATVIIIPMTSVIRNLRFRPQIKFKNVIGQACVDQIKSIDKSRIIKHLGVISKEYRQSIHSTIDTMFNPNF